MLWRRNLPNDVRLQEGHPVDENLRPIKVGGQSTALEVSKEDVRVNNLYVNGTTSGVVATDSTKLPLSGGTMTGDIAVASGFTLDGSGDMSLDAHGGDIALKNAGNIGMNLKVSGSPILTMYESSGNTDDYCTIQTATAGATSITTVDAAGSDADLTINADGDITLNSETGVFIAEKAGTEFSAANSAYAGMILGCTHVFGSGTAGTFLTVSTAWENLLWDTDKYALVTFVVPPSNKVKISVHLPWIAASSYAFQLGLATDSSATTLNTKYENDVDDANRADSFNKNYSWVVEGSDHSWSAGETKTLYIMAYAASNIRFYTGGTNTSGYGGVIVEATALPATIGDGSEP